MSTVKLELFTAVFAKPVLLVLAGVAPAVATTILLRLPRSLLPDTQNDWTSVRLPL